MIDLYQLLETQNTSEIQLDDGTALMIVKEPGTGWSASWHKNLIGDAGIESPPRYLRYVHQAKSVRLAIEAALQARYP